MTPFGRCFRETEAGPKSASCFRSSFFPGLFSSPSTTALTPDPAASRLARESWPSGPKRLRSRAAPVRTMSNDVEYSTPGFQLLILTGIEQEASPPSCGPTPAGSAKFCSCVRGTSAVRPGRGSGRARGAPALRGRRGVSSERLRASSPSSTEPTRAAVPRRDGQALISDGGDAVGPSSSARIRGSRADRDGSQVDARLRSRDAAVSRKTSLTRRVAEMSARVTLSRWRWTPRPLRLGQQALDRYCYSNGARRMEYPSIAAAGPNSCILKRRPEQPAWKDGEGL